MISSKELSFDIGKEQYRCSEIIRGNLGRYLGGSLGGYLGGYLDNPNATLKSQYFGVSGKNYDGNVKGKACMS